MSSRGVPRGDDEMHALLDARASPSEDGPHRRAALAWVVRGAACLALVAVLALVALAGANAPDGSRVASRTPGRVSGFFRLGDEENVGGIPRLPIYFHVEKTGGTSLVLYLLSLLSDTPEQRALVERTRGEDAVFDAELRGAELLCPGSAMFLTTVFVDNAASFTTFPKPLKDSSAERWSRCRLATSHQGQALQTIVRADMARMGAPERGLVPLGMFRDPAQFEQAAWRSELFMYHDDRTALGWGTLGDTKFGKAIEAKDLGDFGDDSRFARVMRETHCADNRDNNYQTKKLVDDVWWRFQERMDAGEDPAAVHAEAVDIALDRVNALEWVGLTHEYETSACHLAYVLRKHPPASPEEWNYDRGALIAEAFRGNHPHSGDADEGEMSAELRRELYECNAMDTLLVKTAQRRFEENVAAMERELAEAEAQPEGERRVPSAGFEREDLEPGPYRACLENAKRRKERGEAIEPVGADAGANANLGEK